MEFDINDIDKMVKDKNLKEITSGKIFLSDGSFDPNGLASYEIFGTPGSVEREETLAYINLGDRFIHPEAYRVLKDISGKNIHTKIINGTSYGYFDKQGKLILTAEEKGPNGEPVGTGCNFLYKNYDIWNIEKTGRDDGGGATSYKEKIQFLNSLKKNEMFQDKVIVIPPYYRDVDKNEKSKNEFNAWYSRLINLASTIKTINSMGMDEFSEAHKHMQSLLIEINDGINNKMLGPKKFIEQFVIGKNIEYGALLVIAAANINEESSDKSDITFDRAIIPLYAVVKCFTPFIVHGVKNIIDKLSQNSNFIHVYDEKTKKIERLEIDQSHNEYFTTDYIKKRLQIFHKSIDSRTDLVTVPTEDGDVAIMHLSNKYDGEYYDLTDKDSALQAIHKETHGLTWLELLYMAAYDTVRDKKIMITRYPVTDNNSVFFSKMVLIPCNNVKGENYYEEMSFLGNMYPKMPNIPKILKLNNKAIVYENSLKMFPVYLSALGGDYDGDQVSVIPIWSEEANNEADKKISDISNVMGLSSNTMKTIPLVAEQTLYNLTIKGNNNGKTK